MTDEEKLQANARLAIETLSGVSEVRPLRRVEWEVLDATSDDVENLEQIYRVVALEFSADEIQDKDAPLTAGCWRERTPRVTLSEIAQAIATLVRSGLLSPVMDENGYGWTMADDLSFVWRAWFEMTQEGRRQWAAFTDGGNRTSV